MSKTWNDSPKPLKPATTNPIFSEGEDTYVVKAVTPMEHQRRLDGSLHSMNRKSALSPKGIDLYISGDKVNKSETPLESDGPLDADGIVKSYMEHSQE